MTFDYLECVSLEMHTNRCYSYPRKELIHINIILPKISVNEKRVSALYIIYTNIQHKYVVFNLYYMHMENIKREIISIYI